MTLKESLENELKKTENEKKIISVLLEPKKIKELDEIVKGFGRLKPEKTFTRQRLFEIAIDNLIQESKEILAENELTDFKENQKEENTEDFDTVIFSGQVDGFQEAFLEEHKWYYVRLGKEKIEKIQYVACYVGVPVCAITHYAKVKNIEEIYIEGKKKYIIYFDGEAKKLPKSVPRGDVSAMAVRSNRYVKLETLLSATNYADLISES